MQPSLINLCSALVPGQTGESRGPNLPVGLTLSHLGGFPSELVLWVQPPFFSLTGVLVVASKCT